MRIRPVVEPGLSRLFLQLRSKCRTATWVLALSVAASCASAPPEESDAGGGDGDSGDGDSTPDPERCKAANDTPAQPFGSHKLKYKGAAILPSGEAGELDDAVAAYYDEWKGKYIGQACDEGQVYVIADVEGESEQLQTVSEAHGYGMLILAFMAGHDPEAKELFDGMFRYLRAHPTEEADALMAWAQNYSCKDVEGTDSATDGDLDTAYALLLADRQWGSGGDIDYRSEARAVIDAVWEQDVDPTHKFALLGNWVSEGDPHWNATRTSDFMPGHFASFAAATGDDAWLALADSGYTILEKVQAEYSADTGLLPDFVVDPGQDSPHPAEPNFLESEADGSYGYNACRDPWRIGMHYLATGETRARSVLAPINTWVQAETGGDPQALRAGYALDGSSTRKHSSKAFTMPFAVGAMVDAKNQDWLDALWEVAVTESDQLYFSDTLQLLTMIALSGNWWAPEAAPCPKP